MAASNPLKMPINIKLGVVLRKFLSILASSLLLTFGCGSLSPQARVSSCKPKAKSAALNIEDGSETSDYQSVVLIISNSPGNTSSGGFKCTGTITGHNVVLTAAHCISSTAQYTTVMQTNSLRNIEEIARAIQGGIKPHTILTHGTVSGSDSTLSPAMTADDVAILLFPDQTFRQRDVIISSLHKIARPPRFADTIMIGFGKNSATDATSSSTAIKRMGRGFYFSNEALVKGVVYTHNRMIDPNTFQPFGPKKFSQAHQGDSGGPLFYKRENQLDLVGIASAIGKIGDDQSTFTSYADLHSDRSLSLLRQAIAKGASFIEPNKSLMVQSSDASAKQNAPNNDCIN